ncbi:MAG: hypothetical protein U0521_17145 [Anaerolineae bacterium]
MVISGGSGNGGGPGSKVFSLTACTNANGGAPELPPPPPPAKPAACGKLTNPAGADQAAADVRLCLPGAVSPCDFIDCLKFFAPDNPSADYTYVINWAILTFCFGGSPHSRWSPLCPHFAPGGVDAAGNRSNL